MVETVAIANSDKSKINFCQNSLKFVTNSFPNPAFNKSHSVALLHIALLLLLLLLLLPLLLLFLFTLRKLGCLLV